MWKSISKRIPVQTDTLLFLPKQLSKHFPPHPRKSCWNQICKHFCRVNRKQKQLKLEPFGVIRKNLNDTEKISMAPAQGWHAQIENVSLFWTVLDFFFENFSIIFFQVFYKKLYTWEKKVFFTNAKFWLFREAKYFVLMTANDKKVLNEIEKFCQKKDFS